MRQPAGSADDAVLLLRRAQSGDAEAFRVIVLRHGPPVRRFLGTLFRDDGQADEAAQETFVRAHRNLRTLREAERLRSWLLGIARIVYLDAVGRAERETVMADPIAPEIPAGGGDPETALLDGEADAVLGQALQLLSGPRRAALLLRLDHRLSYAEIAQAMDWPEHKVKNEIHRARLQIREQLLAYLRGKP
jgi:RNA polymerase sigma-70 factor (ECF subfamily)